MRGGRAASVHARLLALAKQRGQEFNQILGRYAVERLLYRVSVSNHRDHFWLKGALLFDLWFDVPHRPTRDVDFLGFGQADAAVLADSFRAICSIAHDDGIDFDPASISVEEIREGARYAGFRLKVMGHLGSARCPVQIDVGFGDAVTPGPEEIVFTTLLAEMAEPKLCAYPRATVVAEKLEAIVSLGMGNSRMKDYFDLRALAHERTLSVPEVSEAIAATFVRRGTAIPPDVPVGLSDDFARDSSKRTQWAGFLKKNRLEAPSLDIVVAEVRGFVMESLRRARERKHS